MTKSVKEKHEAALSIRALYEAGSITEAEMLQRLADLWNEPTEEVQTSRSAEQSS